MIPGIILALSAVQPLQPTAGWKLAAEDNYCVLSRPYGPTAALAFQPFFGSKSVELTIITPGSPANDSAGTGSVQFGEAKPLELTFQSDASGKGNFRVTRIMAPRSELDKIRGAATLRISAGTTQRSFELKSMEKPLAALDNCETDLEKSWEYHPDKDTSETKPGKAVHARNFISVFGSDVYPDGARDAGQAGEVTTILRIDAGGKPVACRIESAAAMALAQRTCAVVLQRAKFDAATDADGKPIPSLYRLRVAWRLPS